MKLILLSGLTLNTSIRTKYVALFLILNAIDMILTAILITQGAGVEGNPLLGKLPLWSMALVKMCLAILATIVLGNQRRVMLLLTIGMSLVVLWNAACLIVMT